MNPREILYQDYSSEGKPVLYAVLVSLLIHSFLIFGLHLDPPQRGAAPIVVSLVTPEEKPAPQLEKLALDKAKQQIVSHTEARETETPPETRLLSEKNAVTEKEQIKRGFPSSTPAPSEPVLRLSDALMQQSLLGKRRSDTATADSDSEQSVKKQLSNKGHIAQLDSYRPFSRNSFFNQGPVGDPDYLSRIPDGDITLLNTKAERFAVFVRRVAWQVFGALRKHNWADVPRSEVRRVRDFVTIQAILSKNGELRMVKLLDSSGSFVFDKAVLAAVKEGAWDQNPPAGAEATDGTFQFVFKSKAWTQGGKADFMEERWMLLSTGLL